MVILEDHIKIFAVSKIFSLAGVDVELLFYIYLAYGIRGKLGTMEYHMNADLVLPTSLGG